MTTLRHLLVLTLSIFFMSSCVSNRKFLEESDMRKSAESKYETEKQGRQTAEKQLEETKAKLAKTEADFNQFKTDNSLLQERYNQQQRLNKDLQDSYDKLLSLNEKLKNEATSKKLELDRLLMERTLELEKREQALRDEQAKLEKVRLESMGKDNSISDLQKLRAELEKELQGREKRIKDLESAIAERDAQTEALRKKLYESLKSFADAGDLGVEVRNGKVYVSLSQKLLFASGSAKIDKRGLEALKSLADVLSKSSELTILVEGHTDSDGDEKLNWELSTSRAMSVTQELIKDGVNPTRLTAAGRGEHAPKASNDDEKGKGINRRTEIILEPKLDEIMGIINK